MSQWDDATPVVKSKSANELNSEADKLLARLEREVSDLRIAAKANRPVRRHTWQPKEWRVYDRKLWQRIPHSNSTTAEFRLLWTGASKPVRDET
jgi:hypothetical protein